MSKQFSNQTINQITKDIVNKLKTRFKLYQNNSSIRAKNFYHKSDNRQGLQYNE